MEADVRWCSHCWERGEKKRLRLLQINDSLAVLLCENEKCVRLGETSSASTIILQRKASDIPNTKRKKSKPSSASNPTPKAPDFSPPKSSIPSSDAENAKSHPEKQVCSTSPSSAINNAVTDIQAGIFSSTAMPQVKLWENKSSLCWLDACLCLLVACRSLRVCLAKLPEKSSVKTLCTVFTAAQRARTTKKSKSQDSICDYSHPSEETNAHVVHNDANGVGVTQSEHDSPNEARSAEHGQTNQESDPLDRVRDKIYQQLQPMMKCEVGEEESPVVALTALLRLDGSIEEHFMCRYRWEFCCSVCGYTQVNGTKKTVLTFTSVPSDFSMTEPSMLHSCHKCGALQQKSRLVFHSLSACVMMHFQGGLPDSDLSKHHTFVFGDDTYTLAAVVRFCRNPNHFVTVVRDRETNHWLEYDDLMPSPHTWQSQPPRLPAQEVHILVWERLKTPCTACIQMHYEVTSILEAPVQTPASGFPVGGMDAVPQQSRSSPRNGKGIWKQSKFSLSSAFRGKTVQKLDAVNRNINAGPESGQAKHDRNGFEVDKDANESRTEIDRTIEMESSQTVDPQQQVLREPKTKSSSTLDLKSLSQVETKETLKLAGFHQNNTEKSSRNVRTEHLEDSENVRSLRTKVVREREYKTDVPNPTFLGNLASRRKSKDQEDKPKTASAILAKIPTQLMKFSTNSYMPSRSRLESASSYQENTRNSSILNKIPKQLLSGSAASSQQSQSQQSRQAARPILVGSSRRMLGKQAKFQPYGQNFEQKTQQENKKNLRGDQGIRGSASTLGSWQKRVGMYSSTVEVPRKRVRRDSSEDNMSTCSDPPKQAGPPCSSVSSPSACSDISSLSDNQMFASGKSDLTNTIDELCKVLDIGSDYTPSVSSRLSSPSQDMFLSELFADESASGRLEDKGTGDPISNVSRLSSFDNQTPVITTTSTLCGHSLSSTQPRSDVAPSVERFKRQNDLAAAAISSPNPLVGTLPSVGTECPVGCPAQFQSAIPPSCDTMNPVARQQDSDRPVQCVHNSHFSSIMDAKLERNEIAFSSGTNAAQTMDDLTDAGLFEDIQESIDVLGSEWNDNLIELLAQ